MQRVGEVRRVATEQLSAAGLEMGEEGLWLHEKRAVRMFEAVAAGGFMMLVRDGAIANPVLSAARLRDAQQRTGVVLCACAWWLGLTTHPTPADGGAK